MQDNQAPSTTHRGIYLLPNLLTTFGLFAGFYGIVAAMEGRFSLAAVAIYTAMLWDGMDGRVARLTNTQSEFGAQYDSMADVISFGIAPALVAYAWGLSSLGKLGWLLAFFYAASTALRLARFNTMAGSDLSETSNRYFIGLPCPSAAGWVTGVIWVADQYGVPGHQICVLGAIVTGLAGLLMVSNVKYYSFKEIDFSGKVPFVAILIALFILVFVSLDPAQVFLTTFSIYSLSGPVQTLYQWRKDKRKQLTPQQQDVEDVE